LFCVCVIFTLANASTLTISNTIGSDMVLQRAPYASSIFGWADAGDTITVAFNQKNYQSTAVADGSWSVKLDPTAAGGPYSIVVASSAGDKVTLTNILFGDVWLCGGQSNMQFTVASAFNASEEIQAANGFPNIRVFTVGQSHYSPTPLTQLAGIAQGWSVATAATVGTGNWSEFSAVCWFTGRDLYNKYQVPIGLISSNWGGTVIQAWSSPAALKACSVNASGTGNEANSVLYNAMIVPFQNQTILGVLWYQGEQNVGEAGLYACMFPAMIADWRSNFPYSITFLFVQLAPWITTADVQDQRQAQLAALTLSGVGFASAVDLGDPLSEFGSVHPRAKQPVGARLAAAAQALAYGDSSVVWRGPGFQSASVRASGTVVTITILFNLYGSSGLVAKSNQTCPSQQPAAFCANWQVTLNNGTVAAAQQLMVSGGQVQIQLQGVATSVSLIGIKYAYAAWPVTTIFNAEGLPAIPFEWAI